MDEEIIEEIVVEEDLRMDPEFEKELMATFILELGELLAIYRNSLGEIRSVIGDKPKAYKELFRVYHTLKGDAGYFEEFAEFTKFTSYYCEILRNADENVWNNPKILQTMSTNYSLISTAYHALSKGRNLQAMRFRIKEEVFEEKLEVDDPVEEEVTINAEEATGIDVGIPVHENIEIHDAEETPESDDEDTPELDTELISELEDSDKEESVFDEKMLDNTESIKDEVEINNEVQFDDQK